jgi:hypothetical protein
MKVLRSPHPHARILRIDKGRGRTGRRGGAMRGFGVPYDRYPAHARRQLFRGQAADLCLGPGGPYGG